MTIDKVDGLQHGGLFRSAVFVTSEGSHETLQLPSRTVYSSTVLGVYKRSHTPLSLLQPSTDLVSVEGCLEWKLMTILRGFASQAGSVLSMGLRIPQGSTFHLREAVVYQSVRNNILCTQCTTVSIIVYLPSLS